MLAADPSLRRLPGLYRLVLAPLAAAVRSLGVAAAITERDIVAPGGKLSGVAAWLGGRALLVHATLLVDADLDALARVCNGPGAAGQIRAGSARRSRRGTAVTSLARELGAARRRTSWRRPSWRRSARTRGTAVRVTPPSAAAVERLLADRYAVPAWHAGSRRRRNLGRVRSAGRTSGPAVAGSPSPTLPPMRDPRRGPPDHAHHRAACPVETLADLPPDPGRLLFVGLNPSPVSVAAGHYHQGRLGQYVLAPAGAGANPAGRHGSSAPTTRWSPRATGSPDLLKAPDAARHRDPRRSSGGRGPLFQKVAIWRPAAVVFVYKTRRRGMRRPAHRRSRGAASKERGSLAARPCFLMPGPVRPARRGRMPGST